MESAQRLLFVLGIISLSAVSPLSASAAPKAVVNPAKCIASSSDIITMDNRDIRDFGLIPSKFIQAQVAAGLTNSAGLRGNIEAIKPPRLGVRFQNLIVWADLSNADATSCFVVLELDRPNNLPDVTKIVSIDKLRIQSSRGKFNAYRIENNRDITGVSDGVLKAVAVLVRGHEAGSQQLIIGALDIIHRGEDRTETKLIPREKPSCGLLPGP